MQSSRYLMLDAVEENWGLIGPGCSSGIHFSIYSDRSYQIITEYGCDGYNTVQNGFMSNRKFRILTKWLKMKWEPKDENLWVCDGAGWRIRYLSPTGKTIKSSGRSVAYIYGRFPLESITEILYGLTTENQYQLKDVCCITCAAKWIELEAFKYWRTATEILPEGKVTVTAYVKGSRKVASRKSYKFNPDLFQELCEDIGDCLVSADRCEGYCDDHDVDITIYQEYGRKQIMNRGYGDQWGTVGQIIYTFLDSVIHDEDAWY